jgi:hypothetical protein
MGALCRHHHDRGSGRGGNLALLALDVVWDWLARDRFAATDVKEALEARPSTG